MKKPLSCTRSKSPNLEIYEKPSITVERSVEVSIEYDLMEPARQCGQTTLSRKGSRKKATSTTNTTPTACNRTTLVPDWSSSTCPDPVVRPLQDNMSLHEALRSQILPFRQSRRWARTYIAKSDNTKQSLAVDSLPPTKMHTFACDISQREPIAIEIDTACMSDEEPDHHGLCGPTRLLGWQMSRKRRLRKTCSIPVRVCKSAGSKTPNRLKLIKSVRTRLPTDTRRVVSPGTVHSNVGPQDKQPVPLATPRSWRRHSVPNNSQHSLVSALSNDSRQVDTDQSSPAVSSLHDYEKIKRFSQECVNMLSGLDLGDEWRVSIVAPALSAAQNHPAEDLVLEPTAPNNQSEQALNNAAIRTAPQTADGTSPPHSQMLTPASNSFANAELGQKPQLVHMPSNVTLIDRTATPTNNADDEAKGITSCLVPSMKAKSSVSSFNEHLRQNLTKNLKNTRSMDTLTKIEAQVDDTSAHRLQKKSSSFTLASSPKHQRPSGGPPERPLPDLPRDELYETRGTADRQPSYASSCRSRTVYNKLEIVDPFKMSSAQPMIHLPSPNLFNTAISASDDGVPRRLLERVSINGLDSNKITSNSNLFLIQEHACPPSSSDAPLTALKVKDVANERSNKVQQVKKKHVAYWAKPNDTVSLISADETVLSTSPGDSGHETQAPTVPNSARQTGMQQTPTQCPGTEKVLSQNRALCVDGDPVSSHAICLPEKWSSTSTDDGTSQGLSRTLSNVSSITSRTARSRHTKLQTVVSTPNLQQWSRKMGEPKQNLSRSQIMVVVDTNPHTYSFRAGALSPNPSIMSLGSRSKSPVCNQANRETSKSAPTDECAHDQISTAEIDNLAELVRVAKTPVSTRKRRSSRTVRAQSSAQSSTRSGNKQTTEIVMSNSRSRSKASYHPPAESSDSEQGDSPLLRQSKASMSSYARNGSKTITRRSHRRKDTPLTAMLKEEVYRAELERENLKKYEQRIEHLQLHLEQTLKVWDRMSKQGKNQYLTSAVSMDDKKSSVKPGHRGTTGHDTASVAASSIYSRHSSVQRLDDTVNRSLKEALTQQTSNDSRPISGASTATRTGTDTDTDGSVDNTNVSIGKRTSGGSLTDPHDYDPPRPSNRLIAGKTEKDSAPRETIPDSLGTNLDTFRARLQATRSVTIPARSRKVYTPPPPPPPRKISGSEGEPNKLLPDSLSNRFAIAPWEEYDLATKREELGGEHEACLDAHDNTDNRIDRFSLHHETLSTDQMDVMLKL